MRTVLRCCTRQRGGKVIKLDQSSSGYGLHVCFLRVRDAVASSSRGNGHIAIVNLVEVRNILEDHMFVFVQQKRKQEKDERMLN